MLNKTINIGFITRLLTLLSDKDNSVISPYGIAGVLAMAAEGASGNSLNEILTYLGFDTVDELRCAVVDAIKNPCDAFSSENVVTLRKGGDGAKLCEQFKQVMACQYAADVEEKDAAGESTVELSNIATFKAKWLVEMERDITARKSFHNADGTLCRPAFLSCTEELRYYEDNEFCPTVKAVAITCMTLCLKGGILAHDKFRFNKPFRYFLRNTNTGEILFAGKVNKLFDCKRKPAPAELNLFD